MRAPEEIDYGSVANMAWIARLAAKADAAHQQVLNLSEVDFEVNVRRTRLYRYHYREREVLVGVEHLAPAKLTADTDSVYGPSSYAAGASTIA